MKETKVEVPGYIHWKDSSNTRVGKRSPKKGTLISKVSIRVKENNDKNQASCYDIINIFDSKPDSSLLVAIKYFHI